MQTQQLTWNAEPAIEIEIQPARKSSPLDQLLGARASHRKVRIALSLPQRESCLTRRALLAALRAMELADWQASGGDVLRSLPTN